MSEGIITLPDGTKQRITADTMDELIAKAEKMTRTPDVPFTTGLQQGGAEKLVGNLLAVPDLALQGVRKGSNTIRGLLGQPEIPIPEGGFLPSGREALTNLEAGLLSIPSPGKFEQNREAVARRRAMTEQGAPTGQAVGEVGADVATLLTGRAPFRNLLNPAKRVSKSTTAMKIDERLAEHAKQFASSLGSGIGKAAETGIEGAALALLNEQDPVKTAAFAAGGQGAASISLSLLKAATKNPLSTTFITLLLGHQLYRAVGPGQKNIFEASDEAINTIVGAYGLGILASLAGGGRVAKGSFKSAQFEKIADGVITGVRTGIIDSVLKALKEEDDNNQDMLNVTLQNFDEIGAGYQKQITDAAENGKLSEVMDKLKDNKRFRNQVDSFR